MWVELLILFIHGLLMMLSVTWTFWHWIRRQLMTDSLEGIWQEAVES
jgi:hypothetical protein